MDEILIKLFELGWQGTVMAVVIVLARLIWPKVAEALPGWVNSRARREDMLMTALMQATRVMAETVSALQILRGEVSQIRSDQAELRDDVSHIADELDMPRPKRKRPAASPATRVAADGK